MKKILLLFTFLLLISTIAEAQKARSPKKATPAGRERLSEYSQLDEDNDDETQKATSVRRKDHMRKNSDGTATADTAKKDGYALNKKLMFLNAVNFDFTGKVDVSYVGHVNIFAPSRDTARPFGFNVGMMKLNYGIIDTLHEQVRYENVVRNPLQNVDSGSAYLRQANKYKTITGSTVWSLYAQPNFLLYGSRDPDSNFIYLHGHMELLVSKWTASTTITNLSTDTMIYHNDIPQDSFIHRSELQSSSSATKLDGYFGLGLTFALHPWPKSLFFFQPTMGVTTDYPRVMNNYVPVVIDPGKNHGWRGFYLIRAYFTQALNENTQIVLGTDIRGLLPRYDPQYAAYAGVNLSVDGVLGFLGLTGKGESPNGNGGDGTTKPKK
ncbi:MAG: hypothetical protein JSS82_16075 [Bacteroidetes bacterium]|nr:hypothetical protein [Bacteroidota bacterium]